MQIINVNKQEKADKNQSYAIGFLLRKISVRAVEEKSTATYIISVLNPLYIYFRS